MFFGDALSAADAERLGLVNRVVAAQDLEKTAREWAERLAAGPTRALALTKHLVNASSTPTAPPPSPPRPPPRRST